MREAVERDERGERVNRRRFLRRGAITAAVAASGAAVLTQQPAGATNGDPLLVGATTAATGNTTLNATGTNVIALETSSASGAQLRLAPNSIDVLNDTTHTFTEGSLVADSTNQRAGSGEKTLSAIADATQTASTTTKPWLKTAPTARGRR